MLVPMSLLTPPRTNLPLNPFEAEERFSLFGFFRFLMAFPRPCWRSYEVSLW